MTLPHVVVLGAGPAGLGVAYRLATAPKAHTTVLERLNRVGGNAGSFDVAGLRVDYGSHRLHPSCDPVILDTLRGLLGDDLLDRPRHGRIRLHGQWLHFPLTPLDLARHLPPAFTLGVLRDAVGRVLPARRQPPGGETFSSVLEAGLGQTICRDFYFPFARKVWGVAPDELASIQARRRVGAGSLTRMARKVLAGIAGGRRGSGQRFYYPRQGYGQLSEALFCAASVSGATFRLGASVREVTHDGETVTAVTYEQEGVTRTLHPDHVWSTLPISALVRALTPPAPLDVLDAASHIEFRAMILVYLALETGRFTEYDAHYFPEPQIRITRLSEPKNYSNEGPDGRTVLCAELPCATSDPEWRLNDDDLGRIVREDLANAGVPVTVPVKEVQVRRIAHAYPIYRRGYAEHFDRLDRYVGGFHNLLTFGRQGLFAHDNTHHALSMAWRAAECLRSDGRFDHSRWLRWRKVFETHVVED